MTEYGCLMCGKGKTTSITATCNECGNPFDVASQLLKIPILNYTPERVLGRGYYGTVLLAKNSIGVQFALKLCSSALYTAQRKDFIDEVLKYRSIGKHPNIAEVRDAGQFQTHLCGQDVTLYYLVTEYIEDSITLDDFIARDSFNVEDMIGITMQICAAVARVEGRGLWHNDLHGRNILLGERPTDDYDHHPASGRFVVRIVDLGSAIFRHPGPRKRWQDIQWVARHLHDMLERIRRRTDDLSKGERWFLKQLPALIDEATDEHPSEQLQSARDFAEKIELLWQRSSRHLEWQPVRLRSAFGYTNANEFPDDAYVAALFSDNFPWLARITGTESGLLVTGPRGCGKTMILRSMRLRSLIAQLKEDETPSSRRTRLERATVVGFFVSARLALSLYRTLGERPNWLETPELSNAFFSLAFLQEVIDSFLYASEEELALLSPAETDKLCKLVDGFLGEYAQPKVPTTVSYFSSLERLSGCIERAVMDVVEGRMLADSVPTKLRGPKPFLALRDFFATSARAFRGKRVAFLLDDFTQPLVPERCQRAFLPIMFGLPQFIVTAHSKSVSLEDLNGVRYDASREFTEINLGIEFIKTHEGNRGTRKRHCEVFLNEVFGKRFENDATGSFRDKSLRALLGDSEYLGGSVAEEIAQRHRRKRLRGLRFHGVDSLLDLCTGDVSYIIDLVGAILRRHDQPNQGKYPTPAAVQNTVMRMVARREIMKLLDIRLHDGRKLFEIAKTFGQMSRQKILSHASSPKHRNTDHAPQFLRIEVEQSVPLLPDDEDTLRALLQYGIFIDGGWGSAHNGATTQVFLFRKLFCPAFPTTITSRDSFSWTAQKLSRFLRDPVVIQSEEVRRGAHRGSGELFEDSGFGVDLLEGDDFERA